MWWISYPSRAQKERAEIADLMLRSDWLKNVSWNFETGLVLAANFEIHVNQQTFLLQITYPDYFPDVPPSIKPREAIRLSGHQYGAGGALCLEYRPDNWETNITGAMLIESAYRLLRDEHSPEPVEVASAHRTTLGQEIRNRAVRLLLTSAAKAQLHALPELSPTQMLVVEHSYSDVYVAYITRLGAKDAALWSEPSPLSTGKIEYESTALRLPAGMPLPAPLTYDTLRNFLLEIGLDGLADDMAQPGMTRFLLLESDMGCRLSLAVVTAEKQSLIVYPTIEPQPEVARLPYSHLAFAGKRVGIVGCGSIGSKVAASLVRTGLTGFTLIDPDIFLPENRVRNELDSRAIGVNKSAAVRQRLLDIRASCDVIVRSIALGGQESAETTASAMSSLSECDLIIDATADDRVFNLCAAVARRSRKPMIWGQVYGGGIGGMVARSRPDLDPPPQAVRRQLENWYASQGVTWTTTVGDDYDAQGDDGKPLIADDAEVTVIAAHLTRFATDLLAHPGQSIFPCSAYVIGLSPQWLFSTPFEVWPISLSAEGVWGPDTEVDAQTQLQSLLAELIPQSDTGNEH